MIKHYFVSIKWLYFVIVYLTLGDMLNDVRNAMGGIG